jgi:hypothetical protein
MLLILSAPAVSQDLSVRPLQKLIDCPSAGVPESGVYDFELRAFPDGGVLTGFSVGLLKRLGIGLYYGGTKIIGFDTPVWNPQPGVVVMARLLNESRTLPALSVGFINQGYGAWMDSTNRYQFKAKGFYAALGKVFRVWKMGEIGWHLGVNMNPIEEENEKLDFFAGLDYYLIRQVGVIAEYSGGLDDREDFSLGEGKGYLNLGLRFAFAERLALDIHLKDVIVNQSSTLRGGAGIGREIRISYLERL